MADIAAFYPVWIQISSESNCLLTFNFSSVHFGCHLFLHALFDIQIIDPDTSYYSGMQAACPSLL